MRSIQNYRVQFCSLPRNDTNKCSWSFCVSKIEGHPSNFKYRFFQNTILLHYCWWKKSCTTWHVWNPVNYGIFTISTGAGSFPSTVSHLFLGAFACPWALSYPAFARFWWLMVNDPRNSWWIGCIGGLLSWRLKKKEKVRLICWCYSKSLSQLWHLCLRTCHLCHGEVFFLTILTVDGWNPAPAMMVETLLIMGYSLYQLVQDFTINSRNRAAQLQIASASLCNYTPTSPSKMPLTLETNQKKTHHKKQNKKHKKSGDHHLTCMETL